MALGPLLEPRFEPIFAGRYVEHRQTYIITLSEWYVDTLCDVWCVNTIYHLQTHTVTHSVLILFYFIFAIPLFLWMVYGTFFFKWLACK